MAAAMRNESHSTVGGAGDSEDSFKNRNKIAAVRTCSVPLLIALVPKPVLGGGPSAA